MKRMVILFGLVIAVVFAGCYKQIPLEKPMVPVEFKVVPLDEPAPPQGEADIIITTHIKKRLRLKQGSYTIALRSEDRRSDEIEMELEGGKLYTLRFEPFYGLKKHHRLKLFSDGVERYKIYWEEIK